MTIDDPKTAEWHQLCNQIRQIMVERQQEWRRDAACAGLPTAWWFTERGDYETVAHAKTICRECPVQTECLNYGMTLPGRLGIFGGQSIYNMNRHGAPVIRICEQCGDPYSNRQSTARYCGETCRKARNDEKKAASDADKRWNRVNG